MTKDFETQIKEKTDDELADIYINASDYQPEYVKLVEEQLVERKIPTDTMKDLIQRKEEITVNQIYDYAANLLVNERKNSGEVIDILVEKGIEEANATIVVENIEMQIKQGKKERANKDMLYGALWCIGGTVLTVAHVGYIFWGAIIFGGYQFIKGLVNSNT